MHPARHAPPPAPSVRLLAPVVAACLLALQALPAAAKSGGIATTEFNPQFTGCNACHGGGQGPGLEVDGPEELRPRETGTYSVRITTRAAQPAAGFNVWDSGWGALATGGPDSDLTRTIAGPRGATEITHAAPKAARNGEVRFSFRWTAPPDAAGGQVPFYVWVNAVNRNGNTTGDAASLRFFAVLVRADDDRTPTPSASATRTASPTPSPEATPTGDDDRTPTPQRTPTEDDRTRTPTPQRTPTGDDRTPTPSPAPSPSPTASPSPAPTASPTPGAPPCPGDCNGDGAVTVDELVVGVNIALGLQPLAACPAFDADGDGQVAVDDIVTAVNRALGGCTP